MKIEDLQEGLGELADGIERDHEVQMARAEVYKMAKYTVHLHKMLANVSEAEGLEGWVQSKITKAAEMIGSVYHHLDYETNAPDAMAEGKKSDEGNAYSGAVAKAKMNGKKKGDKVKGPDGDEITLEVAGPDKCWDGYKKAGTQKGTGKNAGKRVNKCVPEEKTPKKMDVTDADKKANSPAYQQMKKGNPRYNDKTTKNEAKEEMCSEACCGKPITECKCGPDCKHCDCYEKNKVDEGKSPHKKGTKKYKKHMAAMHAESYTPSSYKQSLKSQLQSRTDEEHSPSDVKQALAIASKMGGNMTGATAAIEKKSKGLSKHKQVAAVLKRANEQVKEGDGIYHDCAKSFKHKKYGECTVIPGEHTLLEDGTVTHYDATFLKDGEMFAVRNLSVESIFDVLSEKHTHAAKPRKKKVKEAEGSNKEALIMSAITKAVKDLKRIDSTGSISNGDVKQAKELAKQGNAGGAAEIIIKGFTGPERQVQDVYQDFHDTVTGGPEEEDPYSLDNLKRDKIAADHPRRNRY